MKILYTPNPPKENGGAPPSNPPADVSAPPPAARSAPPARQVALFGRLGLKPDATDIQVFDAIEALLDKKEVQLADEELIAQKTAKGLTRAQAVAVIQRNREYAKLPLTQERAARKPGETAEARASRLAKLQIAAADAAKP